MARPKSIAFLMKTLLASTSAIIGFSSIFVLAGCGSDDPQARADAVEELAISSTAAIVQAAIPTTAHAELALGDESFDFDSVTCIGTSMATAVAADRANRDGYPTVTLKTFDLSMTGGVDSNTASIQFRSTDRDELWLLHEGSVSKESDLFQASGTVKGKRMVTQPDGTLKTQPLDGDDVKPFRVRIEC